MEFRTNNKRKISFQIFIKVLKGKRRASRLLRAVAPVKCHQRTVWQVAEYYGSAAFLSRTSRQPSLSYSLQWNQPKTESNLQCQIPNIIASIHFITQKWCFHKFWKPQKVFHFTVRIEVSALVTNRAVLVSFHKQNRVVFGVKWNAQSLVNSWYLRPHFSVFSNSLGLFLSFIPSYKISFGLQSCMILCSNLPIYIA